MPFPLKAVPKPEKRLAVERDTRRKQKALTRRQVRAIVWRRDKGICQRCGKKCIEPRKTYPSDPDMGHVNEPEMRSKKKGVALTPEACELICQGCHFGGPSGGHAPTPDRMAKPPASE